MTREEAIKALRETYCGNKVFCELFKIDLCRTTDCEIYHAIKALEAEPIKHGRWEHYKTETLGDDIMGGEYRFKFFRCSECRFDVGGNRGFRYCPNCGAKMDEVEE